ncbi:hypothetical protein NKT34_22790 [Paenibacillus polysaccharolyticus]|uniref:hypothetical protein n=1 Tax=Paenibacillus polysaccharolyticus TaxID=582692 RepID=UPI00209FCEDE|nr:hypothetical protein [Paenibacillus polysaccharolyticus]MCP1136133.1 hypothetical protein [Paenibacillus polysaccharolyticus]
MSGADCCGEMLLAISQLSVLYARCRRGFNVHINMLPVSVVVVRCGAMLVVGESLYAWFSANDHHEPYSVEINHF